MKRMVLIQTALLGDVVLTTPLLRELRRANPDSVITVVTTPMGMELLEGQPFVDEVVPFNKSGEERGASGLMRLARHFRAARFDTAIAAQRSNWTALLVRLAGIPKRIGFESARGAWCHTDSVPWDLSRHAAHRYLLLAAPAGGDPWKADPTPELAVAPGAREQAERLLEESGVDPGEDLLTVSPGSIWATKRWLPEGYAEVIRAAPSRGLRPILVGSPSERDLCMQVARLAGGRVPMLAGRSPIPVLIALSAMSRVVLTNDSGPGHVAAAVGTAVVSIFGPTHPSLGYAPMGKATRIVQHMELSCRPCHHHGPPRCPLGHFRCMRELGPEVVLRALDGVLEEDSGLRVVGESPRA